MAPEDTPTVVYEVAPAVVRSVDRPPMAACGLNLETPAMLAHALDTKTPKMSSGDGIETTRVAEVAQGGASHVGTPEIQLVRLFTERKIADAVEVILGDPAEEVRLEQKIATIKRKYAERDIQEPNPDIAEAHCRILCRRYGAIFVEAVESSFDNLEDAEIAAIFGEKAEELTDNEALMFYVAPMGGNMSKVSRIVYFDRTASEKGFKRAVLKEIKSKDIEKYKTDTSRGQEVFPEDEGNEEDDDETEIVSVPISAVHAQTIFKEKATAEKLRVFQQQGRFKKFPELIDTAHSSAIIYEWKDAVDLETKLETLNTDDALECQEFWLQFADILEAIDELHQLDPTLIHGDLKPGNMGMSKKGQPLSVAIFDIGSIEDKEEVDGTQYTLGSMKDTPFSEIDAYEEGNRVALMEGKRPLIRPVEKPITDYYYSFATTWHAQRGIPIRRIDYFAIGRTIEKLAFGNIDPKEEDKTVPFKDRAALRPICDGLMRYKKSDRLYQLTEGLGLSGIAKFIRQVYQ